MIGKFVDDKVGSRDSWLKNEFTKPYRAPYEKLLAELVDAGVFVFLTPVDEWQSVRTTR